MSRTVLKFINNFLALAIFGLACFILLSPFLPELQLEIDQYLNPRDPSLEIEKSGSGRARLKSRSHIPQENTLAIPDIGVFGMIHEGIGVETMDTGIWRRPHSSNPLKGGNTVLVAHRYMYTSGPNTFYHLPKLTQGQRIILFWNKKEYIYEVTETKVVDPDAVQIEQQTSTPTLTLYTCTPLWTAEKRFVVKAKLI